jgi:hypothetical protein
MSILGKEGGLTPLCCLTSGSPNPPAVSGRVEPVIALREEEPTTWYAVF